MVSLIKQGITWLVVNELKIYMQRKIILEFFLTYMLRPKNNWNSPKKDYDVDFWKYDPFQKFKNP
jgi:hypothetical protein